MVHAGAEVGFWRSQGEVEIEGLKGGGFGRLGEVGGVEDFEERWGERDVGACCEGEAEEGACEVEAEGKVGGCWDEAEGAEGDLHEGVDEGVERGGSNGAVGGEDARPEVEGMGVLPVVDSFVGVLRGVCNAGAQMDRELSDIGKASRVANVGIQAPEFGSGVFHEVNAGNSMDVCCAATFDEALVGGFKNRFTERGVADDSEAAQEKKSGDARCFGACGVGPDVDSCLY